MKVNKTIYSIAFLLKDLSKIESFKAIEIVEHTFERWHCSQATLQFLHYCYLFFNREETGKRIAVITDHFYNYNSIDSNHWASNS